MTKDKSLIGRLVNIGVILSEISITLLMLHVTLQVVLRVAFNISIENVPEIVSYYYMSGLIFMSLGFVTLYDSHIAASLFTEMMSEKVQKNLMIIVLCILACVSVLLAWEMMREAVEMTRIGEIHIGANGNLPKWPARWFLPIGIALMAVAAVVRIVRIYRGEVEPVVGRVASSKDRLDD